MIVFHLRNLNKKTSKGIMVKAQSVWALNSQYDGQIIRGFFLEGFLCERKYKYCCP
jgi:hypothetical protein